MFISFCYQFQKGNTPRSFKLSKVKKHNIREENVNAL